MSDLAYTMKRQDNLTLLKKQAAANVLQQYPLLALKSLNSSKSPARIRLDMMKTLTDLPTDVSHDRFNPNFRKKSSGSGYSPR